MDMISYLLSKKEVYLEHNFILKKVKDYKKKQAAAAENQDADIAMADNLLDEL